MAGKHGATNEVDFAKLLANVTIGNVAAAEIKSETPKSPLITGIVLQGFYKRLAKTAYHTGKTAFNHVR